MTPKVAVLQGARGLIFDPCKQARHPCLRAPSRIDSQGWLSYGDSATTFRHRPKFLVNLDLDLDSS